MHPSMPASIHAGIPYSIILKGSQVAPAGVHRPFLDAGPDLFSLPSWPSNLCSRRYGNEGPRRQVEKEWPKPQSHHACAVQTQLVTFHKIPKDHRKCLHLGSPFLSYWVPFSRLSPTSGPRAPGPRPKVGKRYEHGPKGCPNVAQGCPNGTPRSHKTATHPTADWGEVGGRVGSL